MCFSATANFVGSGVLGAVGVVTLTKVKHRRELLFAALPTLFAIHQFIEGFVWLGLDGILSPVVAHNMGAAFMLYAQGLLPVSYTHLPNNPILRDSLLVSFYHSHCGRSPIVMKISTIALSQIIDNRCPTQLPAICYKDYSGIHEAGELRRDACNGNY